MDPSVPSQSQLYVWCHRARNHRQSGGVFLFGSILKPRTIYLPDDQVQNIDQRARDLGYTAFSKYAWSLIEADLQKAIGEGSIKEERPLTPQEQHDNMVSEMARIGQSL